MPVKKIDLEADIIPGKGIGEIKLLDNAFSLRPLILANTLSGKNIEWTFSTEIQFPDWLTLNYRNIILIQVNIYTGRIVSITVRKGFKGRIYENISIGSCVKDLFKLDNEFYYDDMEEYILHKQNLDVMFDIDLKDRINFNVQQIEESKITEIIILNNAQLTTTLDKVDFPIEWK